MLGFKMKMGRLFGLFLIFPYELNAFLKILHIMDTQLFYYILTDTNTYTQTHIQLYMHEDMLKIHYYVIQKGKGKVKGKKKPSTKEWGKRFNQTK